MIATLLAPTSGTVLIGGRDVSSLSEREASGFRLRELGFIRQNFDLLPGVSAIDNAVLKLLKLMRWRDAHDEIAPLLERLGLAGRLAHRAETLSMGERQRVMIARALSTKPRGCSSPTSRPAASTPSAGAKCSSCCAGCAASATSRSCSSATTRWQRATPTVSTRCATDGSATTSPTRRTRRRRLDGASRAACGSATSGTSTASAYQRALYKSASRSSASPPVSRCCLPRRSRARAC
jgi:hypothetical protein